MAVKGLQETLRYLETAKTQIQDDVKDVIEEFVLKILREAINNAPAAGDTVATSYGTQKVNTGINQFISSELTNGGFSGKVFIEAGASKLAVYLEFGTGASAAGYVPTLDVEFQKIAREYYINGKGTLIKHPFLLPAYFKYGPEVPKAIQAALRSHGIDSVIIP